jgi:hypothetical protein
MIIQSLNNFVESRLQAGDVVKLIPEKGQCLRNVPPLHLDFHDLIGGEPTATLL